MSNQIKIKEIYNHNLNILVGSGASYGLFPTLALEIKGDDGQSLTIETLAEELEKKEDDKARKLKTLLFMYYYKICIKPELCLDLVYDKLN